MRGTCLFYSIVSTIFYSAFIRVPTPYPKWNSLPFPWLYDPYSLPIVHEIVWNLFNYREYVKILDTRGYSFLTIWFCLWSNIIFIILMNRFFQHLWKHEIPYLFLTFWHISQPFLTLSANSLPFQGLKKMKFDSLLFQDFPYQWEPCFMVCPSHTQCMWLRQSTTLQQNHHTK